MLITLVIIGVVAALTIPTAISKYKEKEKQAKVKKAYSTIANAMTRVKAAGGDYIFTVTGNDINNMKDWFNTYIRPYLSISKVCYDSPGCWSTERSKYMNGPESYIGGGSYRIDFILNDGTAVYCLYLLVRSAKTNINYFDLFLLKFCKKNNCLI